MPEIAFQIVSASSLVFAGLLVGYFLWFRDRGEQLLLQEQLAVENKKLHMQLHGKTAQYEELLEASSRLQQKNHSLEQLCDDLLRSRESIQQHALSLDGELHRCRARLDEFQANLNDERRLRLEWEVKSESYRQQQMLQKSDGDQELSAQLTQSQMELRQAEAEVRRLSDSNLQLTDRLQQSHGKIGELKSELQSLRGILENAKLSAVAFEKETHALKSSLRVQTDLLDETRARLSEALSAKQVAENSLAEARTQFGQMQLASQHAEDRSLREFQRLESSLQESTQRIQAVVSQRDAALDCVRNSQNELAALQLRLENQQRALQHLRSVNQEHESRFQQQLNQLAGNNQDLELTNHRLLQQSVTATDQLNSVRQDLARNEERLRTISEENAVLISRISEFELLPETAGPGQREMQVRLESLVGQRDSALQQLNELRDEIGRLLRHNKNNEQTIRNLRRERGAILMRHRDPIGGFPRIHDESLEFTKVDQLAREYGGSVKIDPIRGPLFVEPPRHRDDLKQIHGIARILEDKLNAFGIYSFKQIMDWDNAAVQEFAKLLVFKDRIVRDDWLGQAAQLYYRKTRKAA